MTPLTFAVSACLACVVFAGAPRAADVELTKTRTLADVKFLAADEQDGRGIGTDGLDRAADYIRDAFAEAGLDVTRVDGGAFQKFEMEAATKLGTPNSLAFVAPDGARTELKYDEDFRTCSFGGTGDLRGELVFVGYGIDDPDHEYNDYGELDVTGKVVLIMRRVPRQKDPSGPFSRPHGGFTRHGNLQTKVSTAFGKGAAAVIFVSDPQSSREIIEQEEKLVQKAADQVVDAAVAFDGTEANDAAALAPARDKLASAVRRLQEVRKAAENPESDPLMVFGESRGVSTRKEPILHISQKSCDVLLQAALGKTLAEIEKEIDADLKPRTAVLDGWRADGHTSVERIMDTVKNVIGVLEGEGPLADETVVIGAHYDHVGYGGDGSLAPGSKEVHNGADDNASGTAGLIELARRLAAREKKLPRRLVFIAFTGEERGLVGSARYVKDPVFPLEKTVAMLNMDMIGRLEENRLTVFGTGTSSRWKEPLEAHAKDLGLDLSMKPEGFGPSDHSSFYGKEIPVLHFFTGTHSDYHRPGDDWQKINVEGMARVIGLVEQLIVDTATAPARPDYIAVKQHATIERSGSRPYFGSIPDFGSEATGYAISGAAPGSPADKAGLKGGDVIVQLGETRIAGLDDFDLALRKFSAGDEVDVTVTRDGKPVTLKVILDRPR